VTLSFCLARESSENRDAELMSGTWIEWELSARWASMAITCLSAQIGLKLCFIGVWRATERVHAEETCPRNRVCSGVRS
jgi:hypothetical protein